MQPPCNAKACRADAGFTYLGVLFAVALMGAVLASIATVWHLAQQRENEKQLLFIGKQFRQAIASYYNAPGQAQQFPKKLEDLVEDRRGQEIRRHLRKIFHDPFTGSTDWGLVKGADGGITGVYSKYEGEPVKKANFGEQFTQFEDKKHYSDWRFVYAPGAAPAAIVAQNGGGVPPPVDTIPPEYVPPPPTPDSGSPEDHKRHLCDVMRSIDMPACLNVRNKFGDEAGSLCLASSASRYAACLNSEMLPPLVVQYK